MRRRPRRSGTSRPGFRTVRSRFRWGAGRGAHGAGKPPGPGLRQISGVRNGPSKRSAANSNRITSRTINVNFATCQMKRRYRRSRLKRYRNSATATLASARNNRSRTMTNGSAEDRGQRKETKFSSAIAPLAADSIRHAVAGNHRANAGGTSAAAAKVVNWNASGRASSDRVSALLSAWPDLNAVYWPIIGCPSR